MISTLTPLAVVALIGILVHRTWRQLDRNSRSRRLLQSQRRLTDEQLRVLLSEHGKSANSFMTLYPGFEYFQGTEGVVAFSDMPCAWVGGAQPYCAPAAREQLLNEFAIAAESVGKAAIMLPVDHEHALLAARAGYRSIMIGSEPTWNLETFPRTGHSWNSVVPTAKNFATKGAVVEEFVPGRLSADERKKYDEMTQEWLDSRKMDALGFLNQVDPWFRSNDKRYFSVKNHDRTYAFLAAIPVWANQGWYLIDLIRRSDSPAGSTELLLLQAMRILRESGAKIATMGVAPLSGLEKASEYPASRFAENRLIYKVLSTIYNQGDALYNFKPLHQYKLKFDPSSQPPMFMIYRPGLSVGVLASLVRAFSPGGMARATWSGLVRTIARFSLSEWIKGQLAPSVVVRSVPPSFKRLISRCRFTVSMLIVNFVAYFFSMGANGRIDPTLESIWGFSWTALLENPARALSLSPFLHWDALHLSFNALLLVIFCGGLEYLAGPWITSASYIIAALLSNPMTGATLNLVAARFAPSIDPGAIDIGASLGIFGCGGALALFLKHGRWLIAGLVGASIVIFMTQSDPLALNHIAALAIGSTVAWYSLSK